MAIGAIEIATIARSSDYSNIRHNETTKVVTDQSHLSVQENKDSQQKVKQVRDGENPDWHSRKFDAKEKGSNQYTGDGGNKRKKDEKTDGKVTLKTTSGFDIRI